MRELLSEPIESTLEEAAGFVGAQADRLNTLRDRLGGDELEIPAIDRVATGLDALAERLETVDGDEVVDLVRGLARRRGPWAFAAAGAAIGVLAWGGLRRAAGDDDDAAGAIEAQSGRAE